MTETRISNLVDTDRPLLWIPSPKCGMCSLPYTNKTDFHSVYRTPFLLACQHLMCSDCVSEYACNDTILCAQCKQPTLLRTVQGDATIALHPSYYMMGLVERKQEELDNLLQYAMDEKNQREKRTIANEPTTPMSFTIAPVRAHEIGTPKKLKNLLENAYYSYETTKRLLDNRNKSLPANAEQVFKKINAHFLSLHNALQMEEIRVLRQVRNSFIDQWQHTERQQQRLQASNERLKKLYARSKRFLSDPPEADDESWQRFGKEVKSFLESEPLKLIKRDYTAPAAIFYTECESFVKSIGRCYKLTVPNLNKVMQLAPMAASAENKCAPAGTSGELSDSKRRHTVADRTFTNDSSEGGESSSRRERGSAAKEKPPRSERSSSGPHSSRHQTYDNNDSYKISLTKRVSHAKKDADREKDLQRHFTSVKVTCVVNPQEFYVQDALNLDTTTSLVELCQQEAAAYEANLIAGIDPLKVRVGKLYLVRSDSSTANWYRAMVLDLLNTTPEQRGPYLVQFIDYGGQATVTHECVRPMSKELASIEGRAIRCSLYGVAPPGWKPDDLNASWPEECRVIMMEFVSELNMLMFTVENIGGGQMVDLFQPPVTTRSWSSKHSSRKDPGVYWEGFYAPMSLRSTLIFGQHCIPTDATEQRRREVVERLALLDHWMHKAKAQAQKRLHIPRAPELTEYDSFDVQITHSLSPDQFYLMPMQWKTKDFQALQEELGQLCQGERKCFHPYAGLVCGFTLGDQGSKVWFRGRIDTVLPTGACEVYVLDSGERLTVHWYDLYLLPLDSAPLRKHPLAVCCRLEYIYPQSNGGSSGGGNHGTLSWAREAAEEFNRMGRSKTLRFSVKMGKLCKVTDTYGVVLYLHNKADRDTCINKLLVHEGHAQCIAGKESEINDRMLETAVTDVLAPTTPTSTSSVASQPSRLVDPRIMVEMLRVVSPDEFYVRVCSRKPCLERLHNTIQQHMVEALDGNVAEEDDSGSGECNWAVGDMCVVFTATSDGDSSEWYRGRVTAVQEEAILQYQVFLIDRAESVRVHRTNMARLTSNVSQIQPGAVRCRLACIEPIGGNTSWHQTTLDTLLNTIESYDKHAISLDAKTPNKSDDVGRALSVVLWGIRQTMRQALAPQRTEYRNINQLLVVRGLAHSTGRFRTFPTKGEGAMEEVQLFEQAVDEMMRSEYERLQQFFRTVAAVSTHSQELDSGEDGNETAKTLLNANESDVKVDIDDACAAALSLIDVAVDRIADWPEATRFDKTVFVGMPTYIGNDGTVYIYDVSQEPVLTRMRDTINEHVQNGPPPPAVPIKFESGQPCFVKYHVDGHFYRGKIQLVIEPYRTYRVLFVDYGNEETCSLQDLRPASACGLVPVQSHRFRLSGILPIDYCSVTSLWPEDALIVCHGLFVQKLCKIRVDTSVWSGDGSARHLPIPCHLTLLKDSVAVREALLELNMFKLRSEQPEKRPSWVAEHIPPRKSEFAVMINQPSTSSHPISTTLSTSVTSERSELQKLMEQLQAEYVCSKDIEDPNDLPEEEDEYDRFNRAQLIHADPDDESYHESQTKESEISLDLTPLPSPASFDSTEFETSSRLSAQQNDETLDTSHSPVQSEDPIARSFPLQAPIKPSTIGFFADFINYGDNLTFYVFPHMEGHTVRMSNMEEKVQTVAMSRNPLHRWQASVLEVGAPCLAPYHVDGKYYRAIVEEIDDEREQVRVLYVDYLNRETVAKKDLRKCPIGLRMIALRNVMVRLASVQPNPRLRNEDVIRRLVELLKKPFYVRVIHYPPKTDKTPVVLEVELYTDCDCKELVYQQMIDTKYFLRKATTTRN
uniref:RING finger protein 17 n=1 Tax=Anopheles coluzzii TaxID=1518534 RepID=A0A6E8W7W1_ANOCL